MQFQNLERNKINRLFNLFIPVDSCFCGISLESSCQIIIILQAIGAVADLFLVIYFFSIWQLLSEIGLIILIYYGQTGLKSQSNFKIYLWMMKILFILGGIMIICGLAFALFILCAFAVYQTSNHESQMFLEVCIACGVYSLIQIYCLILIHSYYVKKYDNEQIHEVIDTSFYPNQQPLVYGQQLQTNSPTNQANQSDLQMPPVQTLVYGEQV